MSPVSSLGRRLRLGVRALRRVQPDRAFFLGALRSFVVSFIALAVTLQLLPGEQVTGGTLSVATLAVVVLAVGALLRPLLTRLTVLTGTVGLLVAGLAAQVLILGIALRLVRTVEPFSLSEIFVASWAVTIVAAAVNWLFDASSDEAYLGQVLGQSVRLTHRHGVARPGLLVVQLDGVSEPLLRQAITGGAMPNIARWLRSGTHTLRGWHTGIPATTPAGQAVLMHGETTAVPSFRWFDKELGRLVVASQADDVALVERGFSDGRGLLADGGVSVSNLFSGDASTRVLTVSDARVPSRERGVALFAVNRGGFVRSVVLMVGQMITELHQGRRQRRRDVVPRVRRTGTFAVVRGLTTVVLRDLNVSVVAEHMARSAPAIYVDFVDYDEVAHHAGPSRPESMRILENLDRVLGFFAELGDEVRARYEIAVVSDHGQAQGMTFAQLTGQTLTELVDEVVTDSDEVVVGASGSLAHVYLTAVPGRATFDQIEKRCPGLIMTLAGHPHVGAVAVRGDDGDLQVFGGPIDAYGPRAADDLAGLDRRDHVGDLVVLGRFDPSLGEVVAFEELVGSHGGLGGWQTDALLVHPTSWTVPAHDLDGLDVHRTLIDRLDYLGLRSS